MNCAYWPDDLDTPGNGVATRLFVAQQRLPRASAKKASFLSPERGVLAINRPDNGYLNRDNFICPFYLFSLSVFYLFLDTFIYQNHREFYRIENR